MQIIMDYQFHVKAKDGRAVVVPTIMPLGFFTWQSRQQYVGDYTSGLFAEHIRDLYERRGFSSLPFESFGDTAIIV